jgi:hypothetical protein
VYNIKFGSKKETALARRHKRVENQVKRLRAGKAGHEDSKEMKEHE